MNNFPPGPVLGSEVSVGVGSIRPIEALPPREQRGEKMATVVSRTGITRESGFLYYLDKQGDVSRVGMARGGGSQKKQKPEKVAKAGVTRES